MTVEFQLIEPFLQSYNGHLYQVSDASATDLHVFCLRLEACTMTDGTVGLTPVTAQHHTVLDLVLVLLEHLEERVDARTFLLPFVRREPMPQPVFLLLCQVHIWLEDGEVILRCMPAEPVLPFFHLLSVPTNHTTVIDR